MILVRFNGFTATLDDAGKWHSANDAAEVGFNALFSNQLYPDSPSLGVDGMGQVLAAVSRFGGEVVRGKAPETDEHLVY